MKSSSQDNTRRLEAPPLSSELLNPSQLAAFSARIGEIADQIIQQRLDSRGKSNTPTAPTPSTTSPPKTRRGRPPKRIPNPFFGFLGPSAGYNRYPFFAQDIVEGIARFNWQDRKEDDEKGGSSKPLSVRSMMVILERLEELTTIGVAEVIGTKARQAQRYVRALAFAIPFLMRSRPKRLIYEMDLPGDELANAAYIEELRQKWGHPEEFSPPPPEDLTRLRKDLGEDAFDPDRGINAAYLSKRLSDGHHLATAA